MQVKWYQKEMYSLECTYCQREKKLKINEPNVEFQNPKNEQQNNRNNIEENNIVKLKRILCNSKIYIGQINKINSLIEKINITYKQSIFDQVRKLNSGAGLVLWW